jgi:hypothetical protein
MSCLVFAPTCVLKSSVRYDMCLYVLCSFLHPMLCLMWHLSIQDYFSIFYWILLLDFVFSRHLMSYVTFVNPRLFFNHFLNFTLGFCFFTSCYVLCDIRQSKTIFQLFVEFYSWISFFHVILCLMWHSSIQDYFSIISWILLLDCILGFHFVTSSTCSTCVLYSLPK